jgi:hypothetical protein
MVILASMRTSMLLLLALIIGTPLQADEKDKRKITVRIHAEGKQHEGPSFVTPIDLTNPPKRVFIRQVPIVGERDIESIFPFTADDGSLGCTFVMDNSGRQRILEHTTSARDTIVVALINGRVSCAMQVNKQITNGIITVPRGFLPEEILILQSKHPTLGKEKEFKKQQKEALASLAKSEAAAKKAAKKAKPTPTPSS